MSPGESFEAPGVAARGALPGNTGGGGGGSGGEQGAGKRRGGGGKRGEVGETNGKKHRPRSTRCPSGGSASANRRQTRRRRYRG